MSVCCFDSDVNTNEVSTNIFIENNFCLLFVDHNSSLENWLQKEIYYFTISLLHAVNVLWNSFVLMRQNHISRDFIFVQISFAFRATENCKVFFFTNSFYPKLYPQPSDYFVLMSLNRKCLFFRCINLVDSRCLNWCNLSWKSDFPIDFLTLHVWASLSLSELFLPEPWRRANLENSAISSFVLLMPENEGAFRILIS